MRLATRRTRSAIAVVIMVATVMLGSPLGVAAADAKPLHRYQEYVALGDSWSADVVLLDRNGTPDTTHVPVDCAQSHTNYPKLVAAALKVERLRDATCGSATTDDFARPQEDLPLGGTNAPQFDRLSSRTDLVTVGIGGNDAGIAGAAMDCLSATPVAVPVPSPALPGAPVPLTPDQAPLGGCKEKYTADGTDQLAKAIRATQPKLVRAFKQIHRIAPKSRILAVNYLAAVPEQACYPRVPMTQEDMTYLHSVFLKLNRMVKRAAKQGGAELVDTYTPTLGHDACQGPTVRYVEVFGASVNDVAVGVPAHPNAAGARAQSEAVLARIKR